MSEVSDQTKQKVAELLFKNGLLQFGEFTLKSGALSPFYIDLRKAQSFPELFHAITDAYSELMGDVPEGTLLSGIPEAATSLATAVGYKLNLPLIQPRKVVKDHGTKKSIEGEFKDGDHVWVIDDLITKGDAILVCNFDKNGIRNYIGGNTLMEIGFAHVNNKKVFLLNPIPEEVSYVDEIKAMTDLVINGDLTKIV